MSFKTMGISIAIGASLQSSFGSAFKAIDEKTHSISKNLRKIDFKKSLAINLIKTNKEFQQLKTAQAKAGFASAELKQKIYESAKALHKAREEAREYGITLKNVSKTQKILQKYETHLTKKGLDYAAMQENRNFRDNVKGQILDKLAIGMAIVAPFKVGIEFESAMKRVQALSQASSEEFKKLTETAKKLGATTTFSATETANAMQYLSMAGFKANDTIKAMPGLLSLAAAGQTDLATTADITSNILTGFALSASKTSHVADVLAKTATSSNTTIEMLGETMKYVAPSASSLGASLEEVATLTAKMGDAGIQASNAGTALRAMYARMASPPTEAVKVINQLGLQTKDANGNFVGMINILKQLQEKTEYMSNTQKADIFKKLFGMEAMSGAAALMKIPIKELKEYEKGLEHADGTAKKIAKEQNDTVTGAFKALGSAIEGVSISVSTLFLPAIKSVIKGLTSVASWLNSFIEENKTLATVLGSVGGGMIALSISAFTLRYAFSFLKDGYLALKIGIRSVVFWLSAEGRALAVERAGMILSGAKARALAFWQGMVAAKTKLATLWANRSAVAQKTAAIASGIFKVAVMGVNFALRANPIGLVVTAIGALVSGLVWAYHKFDWFKKGVHKTWEFIKKVFSFSPLGLIVKAWGKAFRWLESKFGWLKKMVSGIKSFFGFGGSEEKKDNKYEEEKKKSKNWFSSWLGSNEEKKPVSRTVKKVAAVTVAASQLAVAQPHTIKPQLQVAAPAVQTVQPHIRTLQPAAQTIKPKIALEQPKPITPKLTVSKTNTHYIKPQLKVLQPDTHHIKPKLAVAKPAAHTINPDVRVLQPAAQTIKPKIALEQPSIKTLNPQLKIAKPKLNYASIPKTEYKPREVRQTNNIKVIINNPSSTVDVQKAIVNAMKENSDRSLSDEDI